MDVITAGSTTSAADTGSHDAVAIGRIALVGNFLPRRCGIATFTSDVHAALRTRFPAVAVDVWAMDDRPGAYAYPPEVTGTIDQDDRIAYSVAAQSIDASGADLVWLQHEYGIFGGPAGDLILHLLDQVTCPVATHVHTVLETPDTDQRRVLERIVARSALLIVMAEQARKLLISHYGARPDQVVVIPHGIPDRPFLPSSALKPRFEFGERPVVLTFGLLSPGKGIETMIAAMAKVVSAIPDALYVVLGATHPHLVAREGEAYRDKLQAQALELGIADNVRFVDGFIEQDELLDYLGAADIYATPYLNPAQVTSGTLAYAVGLGKAVVSTPYVHARELLGNGNGCLVEFGDSAGFADAIIGLLRNPDRLDALRERTYALGREMIWPRLAEAAMGHFVAVVSEPPTRRPRLGMPSFKLGSEGVARLTDDTGIFQHSVLSVPDRAHGYCIDDNARALMFAVRAPLLDPQLRTRWTRTYAAFVEHAWNPDLATFRNFMGFDRRWLEAQGSDDSNGRTVWALGAAAAHGDPMTAHWALTRYEYSLDMADRLDGVRARAFAMLGAAEVLSAHPLHSRSRELTERFGNELIALLDHARRPDWAWFEIVLAYDNCRLPEALIRGGGAIGRADMVTTGLATLEWIATKQTARRGFFRPVGHESFGREYAEPLPFDQQPVEAWATIDACAAAFDATGDVIWHDRVLSAWRWFFGDNDLGIAIADARTGDCGDGLTPAGANLNRGAESVLALQLSALTVAAMHDSAIDNATSTKRGLRLAAA